MSNPRNSALAEAKNGFRTIAGAAITSEQPVKQKALFKVAQVEWRGAGYIQHGTTPDYQIDTREIAIGPVSTVIRFEESKVAEKQVKKW